MIARHSNMKKEMPKCPYPYIRAWEELMGNTKRYLDDQLALAERENAPHDAMWRGRFSGHWHCFSEMAMHNRNKALIAAYVKGIEDGTSA